MTNTYKDKFLATPDMATWLRDRGFIAEEVIRNNNPMLDTFVYPLTADIMNACDDIWYIKY